jgi:MFS family permease
LLALEVTNSVGKMGLVSALIGVGNLISSLVSGVIVDRMDRRKVMILCDAGRALFYPLIPLMWMTGSGIWLICVIAMITAYLTTFFFIAYTTAVANLVDKDQITAANGRLQATVAAAYVAGPLVAGYAADESGAIDSVLMLSGCYTISAFFMSLVRLRKASPNQPDATEESSRVEDAIAGARFLLRHPVLKPVSLLFAILIFAAAPIINLMIFRLRQELGQDDGTVGVVFGVSAIGAILAGALASAFRKRLGFGLSFLGSNALIGVSILLIGLAQSVAAFVAFATLLGFGVTLRNTNSMSLRQQVTPDRLLGRVSGVWWIMLTVLGPAGNALGAALAESASVKLVFIISGIVSIATATIGLFTRANSRRPEQETTW